MRSITSFIDGEWTGAAGGATAVADKFDGTVIARLHKASASQAGAAVEAARRAFDGGEIALGERIAILQRSAAGLAARRDEFVDAVVGECGQTVREARREVDRAIHTFHLTAQEAARIDGELVPVEGMVGGGGKFAYMRRFPLGVVCAITAFNSPLNTPVHKIAPALAAGNAVVFKPPTATPLSGAMLCDVMAEAGLPPGWLNYVAGDGGRVGSSLLGDPRVDFYHFTGSTAVGRLIAGSIGMRRSALELGSIAATIVAGDSDMEAAGRDIARAAFAKAGQVCTSTQIVYVERRFEQRMTEALVAATGRLSHGDPRREETDVGPLIAEREARRVEQWIGLACEDGARCLIGGRRQGSVLSPAVLAAVGEDAAVRRKEVFGPVVSIVAVDSSDEAIERFNREPYGLSVGFFTRDIERAFAAARRLRAGTVHLNGASSGRLDAMPFGGVKDSGHGKEGPKYAIAEMTEQRLTVWHGVP